MKIDVDTLCVNLNYYSSLIKRIVTYTYISTSTKKCCIYYIQQKQTVLQILNVFHISHFCAKYIITEILTISDRDLKHFYGCCLPEFNLKRSNADYT